MPKPPATATTTASPKTTASPAAGSTQAAAPATGTSASKAATTEPLAHEPEPLPKDLPPYGKERSLPPLRIEQRKLENGLTVWVLPREDGPPKIHFVLTVRGGFADDSPLQPGFSSLLAAMLKEGTVDRDALQIAQDLQACGGDLQSEAGVDGITLSMSGLASSATKLITLLSEVALQPAFAQHEVDLAKLHALAGLTAAQADPDYQARRAMRKLLFGGHPYNRALPNQASIASVTSESLFIEHGRRFRPDQGLLVITGRIAPAAAFALAESVFDDWRVEGKPLQPTPALATDRAPGYVFVNREGSVQSAIRVGRPSIAADSPDYFPLQLTNAVLGGGFRSRLNLNLREDKGYTYGAGTALDAERAGGSVVAAANVRNAVTGAAIAQIMREYARLGTTLVPEDELAQTKHYLAGGYLLLNQQQVHVAHALSDYWLVGLPPQTLSDYVPKLQSVSPLQIQAMARKYFAPKDQSIVVVGDAAVQAQLAPFGSFDSQ